MNKKEYIPSSRMTALNEQLQSLVNSWVLFRSQRHSTKKQISTSRKIQINQTAKSKTPSSKTNKVKIVLNAKKRNQPQERQEKKFDKIPYFPANRTLVTNVSPKCYKEYKEIEEIIAARYLCVNK